MASSFQDTDTLTLSSWTDVFGVFGQIKVPYSMLASLRDVAPVGEKRNVGVRDVDLRRKFWVCLP